MNQKVRYESKVEIREFTVNESILHRNFIQKKYLNFLPQGQKYNI